MTLNSSITHLTFFSLRLAFFLACKRYVHHSLLNDLNRVTITSTRTSSSSPATTTITTTAITTTAITTTTTSSSSSSSSSSHQIGNPLDLTSKSSTPDSIPSPDHHPSSIIPSSHSKSFIHQLLNQNIIQSSSNSKHVVHQFISSTISILLFCWTFSEGSLLFSIVVLGSWLDPHARDFNWNLSLTILISSVVFIVPFLECLLFSTSILSRRPKPNERMRLCSIRTLGLTSLPFGIYLFVYYRLGQIIQGLLGVESGSHKFGFLNTTLARICVPGVILIASLSGGGAVNTAWLTWEWRNREKEPPVTDQQIAAAEKSLTRTRTDLAGRKSILQQQMNHSPNKPDGSSSLLNTLFTGSSSSNPKTTQLQQEIAGLEAMEIQIINDINLLKGHKESYAYSRTIPGMLFNIANWLLSVYCIYRLFMACVNLIFGYVKQPSSRGGSTTSGSPTTDIVTYLVAKILMTFSIELEITKLSRLVGLVLIGSIILVNLRAVLVWVHRVFNRLGSSGISSSLMLLVLGQLMAMYLLTCLISLPSSASTSIDDSNGSSSSVPGGTSKSGPEGGSSSRTEDLLNTLPSFSRFSKLFDLVFLSTGILTFLIRWLIKQIQDPNSTSSSFSLYLPTPISNGSTDESIVLNQRLGAHFV